MADYSQITFDFFTPPTQEINKQSAMVQPESPKTDVIAEVPQEPAPEQAEVVEVFFPESMVAEPAEKSLEPDVLPEDLPPVSEEQAPVAAPGRKSNRGRKSLKSFALAADLVNIPDDEILFQKQYYSIGEVSGMFNVNASLLRFWESEFDIIQPRKNRKGDRHFRPVDIKNLQLIYDLLRRRKLTIEGAKDFLKKNSRAKERFEAIQSLQKIRSFLVELKATV